MHSSTAHSSHKTQHSTADSGFSLLELVVAVSIMLIIAVVGFVAYQNFTDNAREAAVERAATDVFTAAIAAQNMPQTVSAHTDDHSTPSGGIQFAAATMSTDFQQTENETLIDIQDKYNESGDSNIDVMILTSGQELTTVATGWETSFVHVRSTEPTLDRLKELPDTLRDAMAQPRDFAFITASENTQIYLGGRSDDAYMTFNGEEFDMGSDPVIDLPYQGEYVYTGDFATIGAWNVETDVLQVTSWGDTGTTNAERAFSGSDQLTYVDTPPSTITNMAHMFRNAASFNQDISGWDVSKVTTMSNMFHEAHNFNNGGQPLDWGEQTSNVTDMGFLFYRARAFDQDISNWNVSNVVNMNSMLNGTTVFTNGGQPLDWDDQTGNVTDMGFMFRSASAFNHDISDWDVSQVTNMEYMFNGARAFDQNLTPWDVSSLQKSTGMFRSADAFDNGGAPLTDWMIAAEA